MKFDRLKHSLQFVTNPGNRFKKIYHGEIQEDGSIELVYDGVEDTLERMRADAVGCDLASIVARATAGDPTAFRKEAGFYGDVVGMPKTYAEILNVVNDGKSKFDKLPIDVKEKFDFDFNKWFATLGSNEWYEKHGVQKNIEKVDEVKSDES